MSLSLVRNRVLFCKTAFVTSLKLQREIEKNRQEIISFPIFHRKKRAIYIIIIILITSFNRLTQVYIQKNLQANVSSHEQQRKKTRKSQIFYYYFNLFRFYDSKTKRVFINLLNQVRARKIIPSTSEREKERDQSRRKRE